MKLKYKLTEAGNIAVNDRGLPIVINEKDEEVGLDAIHLYEKVPSLTNQLEQAKTANNLLTDRLSMFAAVDVDIENADAVTTWFDQATKAIGDVANFDEKAWVKVKDVDSIKKAAQDAMKEKLDEQKRAMDEKLTENLTTIEKQKQVIYKLLVADQFNTSPFVKDKLAMTSKMAFRYFSDNLKVEADDAGEPITVAYYNGGIKNGEKVYSKERVGEVADFEEAMLILTEYDPDKSTLLLGDVPPGSGAAPPGGHKPGGRTNPWAKDTYNLTEQGKLVRENPQLAKRLAKEAGKTLDLG